jgi:hypothetical protein
LLTGDGSHSSLPSMYFSGGITLSLYICIHSFRYELARLIEIGSEGDGDRDSIVLYSQTRAAPGGLSLSMTHNDEQSTRIHTKPDVMKIGKWQHVVASID